jgi:ABC-2 type transport system ATP-binding protein
MSQLGSIPPRPDAAVETRGLSKAFGRTLAVQSLDLQVPRGCFFGLVGPNGAGKTTTLRMITGLLRPDGGTVLVDGIDVWSDPVRAKAIIGVVPEEPRLFERLTGVELLTYSGLLRDMPPDVVARRAEDLLNVLDLSAAGDALIVDYSHGMRRKITLAAALLHAPKILFLDEPFEAVDPISARTIRAVLERDVAGGATIVFSSHVMEIVERLCDRVGILHRGRLVAEGSLDEVRAGRTLEDAFVELVGAAAHPEGSLEWLDTSSS